MGFIKRWDAVDICRQINTAARECSSPYNDGFVAWQAKQDLYKILWAAELALKSCPEFSLESDWLKEQEKTEVWNSLNHN